MEYLSLHPAINSRWQQTKQDSYISPSLGNESYFFLFRNSLFNLFHSFINGSNPKQSFSFCHSGVYKSGTNIGSVNRIRRFSCFLSSSFHIVDLIGFRRIVGGSDATAARTSNRGNSNQMPAFLLFEISETPVCDVGESYHVR